VPEYSYQKKEFGFKAKTKFEEGLKNTIEWYIKKNQSKHYKGTGPVHKTIVIARSDLW
jgi:dTDP-D-glucose 4,6-dehydratase